MKTRSLKIIGLLMLAIMAPAQLAQAQQPMLVNVPFDFTAGDITLPAGEYSIQKWTMGTDTLLIRRTDRHASAFLPTMAALANRPQVKSKLVFHRYGNRYFLSQIWVAGSSRGNQLRKSQREEELALTADLQPREQVVIAALE